MINSTLVSVKNLTGYVNSHCQVFIISMQWYKSVNLVCVINPNIVENATIQILFSNSNPIFIVNIYNKFVCPSTNARDFISSFIHNIYIILVIHSLTLQYLWMIYSWWFEMNIVTTLFLHFLYFSLKSYMSFVLWIYSLVPWVYSTRTLIKSQILWKPLCYWKTSIKCINMCILMYYNKN